MSILASKCLKVINQGMIDETSPPHVDLRSRKA